MRLRDILGQDRAVAVLRRALAGDRLAHAYLFDGPAGVGKRTTAVALGLALVCPQRDAAAANGCGVCATCARVLAGNHPDVLLFDAAQLPELTKASGEKSAVKYAARHVFPYALAAPHEARARLLVIENADELSPDVQNTLLKTLEEPRQGVHLVLVTAARDRLLPTILSRTQRIRFGPVSVEALRRIAERQALPVDRAVPAAALAGGSVARLCALVTAEGEVGPFAEARALRRAAGAGNAIAVFDAALEHGDKESKEKLPDVLGLLANLYRDALFHAAGAPELGQLGDAAAPSPDVGAVLASLRDDTGALGRSAVHGVLRSLEAIVEADESITANVNAVTVLERLMFELSRHARGEGARPIPRKAAW